MELWKLGVYAKTEHNEAAPAQHELAPLFTTANIAADHNQLTMELMKKTALKHGLVCLLHEKPFAGVNGSGKHNNWSLLANDGQNLLDPGDTPQENLQFLLFLCAIIKAVHTYAPLLRLSAASAGNDHRLGANEAPPAIVSIFIGSNLEGVLNALEKGKTYVAPTNQEFVIGVDALPNFPKDTTDRNRTSPFAFTGNKFEYRMLGSSDSISCVNTIINTIVAQVLSEFADELEQADNFESALRQLMARTIKEHKSIIFNGNGYSEEWIAEAERRGLPNLPTTADALPHYLKDEYVSVFEKFKIYTRAEIASRTEILLDNYNKVINIEALTMLDMANKQILPAAIKYTKELCDTVIAKKAIGIEGGAEEKLVRRLSDITNSLDEAISVLNQKIIDSKNCNGSQELSMFCKNEILPSMQSLRALADELETIIPDTLWPFPTYLELLFMI